MQAKPVAASWFPRVLNQALVRSRFFFRSPQEGRSSRCRAPRRAGSARCVRPAGCLRRASASWTKAAIRSKYKACSPFPWRICAARRRACFPGCSGDCRASRTTPPTRLGVEPGPPRLRRHRVRRAVLLSVTDPVPAAARLVVCGADRWDQCGDRLRHRRVRRPNDAPLPITAPRLVAAFEAGALCAEDHHRRSVGHGECA